MSGPRASTDYEEEREPREREQDPSQREHGGRRSDTDDDLLDQSASSIVASA